MTSENRPCTFNLICERLAYYVGSLGGRFDHYATAQTPQEKNRVRRKRELRNRKRKVRTIRENKKNRFVPKY